MLRVKQFFYREVILFFFNIYLTGKIVKRVTVGSQLECPRFPMDQSTVANFIFMEYTMCVMLHTIT